MIDRKGISSEVLFFFWLTGTDIPCLNADKHFPISSARSDCECPLYLQKQKGDLTNLNRQQYGIRQLGIPKPEALKAELLEINPYLEIATDWVKLTEENMKEILQENYICEAFDSPEQKAMLTNFVLEYMPEKYQGMHHRG